jgi:hypothetical protein
MEVTGRDSFESTDVSVEAEGLTIELNPQEM